MDKLIKKYDIVHCIHLSFFKEPSLLIKQMDHILKPEGMIMIDLYNSLNKKNLRLERLKHFLMKIFLKK